MKIALPLDTNNSICEHFGHSSKFLFVEIENGEILNQEVSSPPPHQFGAFPMWLISKNVNVLLCKGIGFKAVQMLEQHGIKVYSNVKESNPEIAISSFINNELTTSSIYCNGSGNCH